MNIDECRGIEEQLFSWEEWDVLAVADLMFYNCELKVDIGPFKIGDKVDAITLMFSKQVIQIDHETETFCGKLTLSVEPLN